MAIKNFPTALYIMRLMAGSKYDGLLKIGISNNVERRAKEIGNVGVEYQDDYKAPRAVVMATEMLAQAYAYRKVGRPTNFRQVLPVKSGSSEFYNTDNIRQARGFIGAAKRQVNRICEAEGYEPFRYDMDDKDQRIALGLALEDMVEAIVAYVKDLFKKMKKAMPQSFKTEISRIYSTVTQEVAAL